MAVAYGRSVLLDGLGFVRQTHAKRYVLPLTYRWIRSPAWIPSLETFVDALAEEVAARDGSPKDKAAQVIEDALAVCCARRFRSDFCADALNWRSWVRDRLPRVVGPLKRLETRLRIQREVRGKSPDLAPIIDSMRHLCCPVRFIG